MRKEPYNCLQLQQLQIWSKKHFIFLETVEYYLLRTITEIKYFPLFIQVFTLQFTLVYKNGGKDNV